MPLAVWEFRRGCAKNDAMRDNGLETPGDILRIDNISYGPYGKENLLDLYRPKAEEGNLPVIISVHGGGWIYGNKEVYQHYCMNLAQRGFAVVNFNYRLAPESKFPSQLEDLNEVVKFLLKNYELFNLDINNIFMIGDSAGANLAALYACICTNPEYAEEFLFEVPEAFVPKALALNCGIYSIVKRIQSKDFSPKDAIIFRSVLGGKITKEKVYRLSPNRHITEKFPPTFVMTANEDFLRDQPRYLLGILKLNKIPFYYKMYGDEIEPLQHVFHCDIRTKAAEKCNDDECEFFRSFAD